MAPTGVVSVKSPEAFRTISEVAAMLDVPQHVLRFWETRFSQIKPIKRAGGRRFYRPEDVDLLRGIQMLLYLEGYTIRGAQKILREKGVRYTAALGREQVKNGHAVAAAPEEIATVREESGFAARDALTDVEEDAAEKLSEKSDEPVLAPEPIRTAEAQPAQNPRRAQLEAMCAELQELKSRLATARSRTTT
jgi:DNA-binding transcriptional MerR regulator